MCGDERDSFWDALLFGIIVSIFATPFLLGMATLGCIAINHTIIPSESTTAATIFFIGTILTSLVTWAIQAYGKSSGSKTEEPNK